MTHPTYEDRLLSELRAHVAARPSPVADPALAAPPPARPRRRLLAAGGGLATAGVAAAVILLATGGSVAPAYAVERAADGDITVHVSRLDDADGLQRALRAEGVNAKVVVAPAGQACVPLPGKAAAGGGSWSMQARQTPEGASLTIPRGGVGTGETLVLSTSDGGGGLVVLGAAIVEGTDGTCTLTKAPGLPAPGTASGGTSGRTEQGLSMRTKPAGGGSAPSLSQQP
jgi:hypothetical protein